MFNFLIVISIILLIIITESYRKGSEDNLNTTKSEDLKNNWKD